MYEFKKNTIYNNYNYPPKPKKTHYKSTAQYMFKNVL